MKTSTPICGIYKISNIINGKFYIGSSKDINHRWREHLKQLRNFKHPNAHLQSSWEKYDDEEIFQLSIVEECIQDKLLEREQHYIDTTKCYNKKIGYNTCKIAGKGPDCTGLRQYTKMKQVNQYTLDGKYIKSFICALEAEKETGVSNKRISSICTRNTYKSGGGFMWTHGIPLLKINTYKQRETSSNKLKEVLKQRWVSIFQYDLDGNFIKEYNNTKEASILYPGASHSAYNYVHRKTSHGYQWRLFKTNKLDPVKQYRSTSMKIYQYDILNKTLIKIHNDAKVAAVGFKNNRSADIIRQTSNGQNNYKAYGFIWTRQPLQSLTSSAPPTNQLQSSPTQPDPQDQ